MNSSLWKKILLLLIFLITPTAVSANGSGIVWLALFGFMGVVVFAVFLIPIFLLYLLHQKGHLLLLLVDVIFAAIYAFIISLAFQTNQVAEILPFAISSFAIFVVALAIVLLIKKVRGRNILALSKVFLHWIMLIIITILLAVLFTYAGVRILYATDCDTNLFFKSEFRKHLCIIDKAIEQANPTFCNKINDFQEIDFCKLKVNIEMVESGNLSGCSYLKSKEGEVLYHVRGQEILERCTER